MGMGVKSLGVGGQGLGIPGKLSVSQAKPPSLSI